MTARAIGLLLGHGLDHLFGDPQRHHPVAWFGSLAERLERRIHRADSSNERLVGAGATVLLVGGSAALGALIDVTTTHRPMARVLTTATATWIVLGGRSLDREGAAIADHLDADDIPAARRRIRHLVGRDPENLDATDLARAATESLAENTSDAVVAPLVWGALGGCGGLLAHRAANTLDAMWGHRTPRWERFGWAAARLDDVLNLPGSRLTAVLITALAPTINGRVRDAWHMWRRDAPKHPSPNAGPVEAALAGAIGVQLGGQNTYAGTVEDRGTLGDGPPPDAAALQRTRTLTRRVGHAAAVVAAAVAGWPWVIRALP